MENKINKEENTVFGKFTLFDGGGVSIDIYSNWIKAFQKATLGVIFEEDGLKGIRYQGDVICPPFFKDIGIVYNPTRLYLVDNDTYSLFENDESYIMNADYSKRSHFIFKDGYMGWWKEGKTILLPIYNLVGIFGMNIYETIRYSEIKYFTEDGNEVLTYRRDVCEHLDSPFSLRTDCGNVLSILECPPVQTLPQGNRWLLADGTQVGMDRFNRTDIIKELINPEDDLPLTPYKLRNFTNEFSYEFSAYRFTVKGEKPINDLINIIRKFGVDDNTWYYIIRLTTSTNESLSVSQLRTLNNYINVLGHRALNKSFAIGRDYKLDPGEVSALIITYYNECCFPPSIFPEWINVCKNGTLKEVIKTNQELIEYTSNEIITEYKKDFLEDCYSSAISNIRWNSNRSWNETKNVLDYLAERTLEYHKILQNAYKTFNSLKTPPEKDFYLKFIDWLLSKGVDANPISNAQTLLDKVNKKVTTIKDESKVKMWVKFREILLKYDGKTYHEIKNDFLKDHTEYEFALYLLSQ